MLKRVKMSLSKTQKRDVEGSVSYIYCKMFCEICRKQKPSQKGSTHKELSQVLIERLCRVWLYTAFLLT